MTGSNRTAHTVTELRNSVVALARSLRQTARADSETWTALMVLGAIERAAEQASPKVLGEELGLRSSNLAQVLRDLDERGLLRRAVDASDGRKVRLSLTKDGLQLVRDTRAQRDQWLAEAMQSCLSAAEQAQLLKAAELMQRLARFSPPDL